MTTVDLVTALIVAGCVIIALGITVFALWERNGDNKRANLRLAKELGRAQEQNSTLREDLGVVRDNAEFHKARAEKLLARLYQQQPSTDCYAKCFVAYAGKNYDDVCVPHFDQFGEELSRDRA